MTIEQALLTGQRRLTSRVPDTVADTVSGTQAWIEAEMLLSHVLGCERTWLIAHGDVQLSASQKKQFFKVIDRREQQEPLAYLLQWKEFCGLRFHVNRHVLIPRPETEEMVERVSLFLKQEESKTAILDVGTGSGAIGISVKHRFPDSMVIASDAARTMINFNSVAQCWVTTVDGAWGPTSAIEVYDRHGRCSFVASQTGPVNRWIYDAWEQLIADLVD